MATNSQYLRSFHDLERELWGFFSLFGDLCGRCARKTIRESAESNRRDRDQWCCCMIDNQVHDTWESLNPVQCRQDGAWYEKLTKLDMGRMPGNGPCPALGPMGCQLRRHRPITCTTQLCAKMLRVLKTLKLYNGQTDLALQIEDIIPLPNILPALYGTSKKKDEKVTQNQVDQYRQAIRRYRHLFFAIEETVRRKAIDEVLPDDGA